MANAIAANDLALDDLPVQSNDVIGEATIALNTMKNNLGRTVEAIAETAAHVASAGEQAYRDKSADRRSFRTDVVSGERCGRVNPAGQPRPAEYFGWRRTDDLYHSEYRQQRA